LDGELAEGKASTFGGHHSTEKLRHTHTRALDRAAIGTCGQSFIAFNSVLVGAHTASYVVDTKGSFPGSKAAGA